MPIYIVRWANRSASIVRAHDEAHLQLLLDEVGDPAAALWEEYDGPLWIELEPRWREVEPGEFEIDDDHFNAETQPWDILEPGVATCETSLATYSTILARLFPHLYTALNEIAGAELSDDEAKPRIVEALEHERWFEMAYADRPRHQMTPAEMALYAAVLDGELHVKRDPRADLQEIEAMHRKEIEWREAQYARLHAARQQALEELASSVGEDVYDDGEFDDDELD